MNIDIRKSIINNFKDASINDLISSIDETIKSNDEVILPGLGVIFEILWLNSKENEKDIIANNIFNGLKK